MKNLLPLLALLALASPLQAKGPPKKQYKQTIIVPEAYLDEAEQACLAVSPYARDLFTVQYKRGAKLYYVCHWPMTKEQLTKFTDSLGGNYRRGRVQILLRKDPQGNKKKPRKQIEDFGLVPVVKETIR